MVITGAKNVPAVAKKNRVPEGRKWLLDWNRAQKEKIPTAKMTTEPIHVIGFLGIFLPYIASY